MGLLQPFRTYSLTWMAHGKVSFFYDAAGDHWAEKVTESSFSPLVVVFGRSVLCDSLRPHGLQHTRLPVFHYLLEFAQTYARWVSDAIQPSHPLSSPTPPAFNLFQHQGLFQWVSSSHQVAKVLELQLQHQFFQWISRVDLPLDWLVWSWCPRDYSLLIS